MRTLKVEQIYIIRTKSKLLAEFSQCPEGMAKIILMLTLPFWAISWIVRSVMKNE
jgi:hypothetical protein